MLHQKYNIPLQFTKTSNSYKIGSYKIETHYAELITKHDAIDKIYEDVASIVSVNVDTKTYNNNNKKYCCHLMRH